MAEYQPKIITNEDDYKSALESIELLMHREELTPEAISLLKLISTLVEAYEDTLIPQETPSPQDILLHLMEACGLKQLDLVGIIGSEGVVSEIFNGKKSISKFQAKALGDFFSVSPTLFA